MKEGHQRRSTFPPFPCVALIRRELLRNIRTTRLFLALLLLVSVGVFGVLGMWPRSNLSLVYMASMSQQIMVWLGMVLLGAACLLIPGYAGGAILEERNLDTFDLLRTSLIRPSGILVGKFVNVVGLFFLLILAAMPLLATTYFLVGLNMDVIFLFLFTLAVVTITCTSIGLACSANQRNSLRAILHSYIWSAFALGGYLIFMFLGAFVVQLSINSYNIDERAIENFVEWTARGSAFYPLAFGGGKTGMGFGDIATVCAVQFCFSLFPLLFAWRRLHHPRELQVPGQRRRFSLFGKKKPVRNRGFASMPAYRNPVFLREFRYTGIFRTIRPWQKLAFLVFMGFTNVLLFYVLFVWRERPDSPNEYRDLVFIWSGFVGAFILLTAPATQAISFVREHEQDTKDLLAMTLLSSREIVLGKMRAGLVLVLQLFAFAYACSLPVFGIVLMTPKGVVVFLAFASWTLLCATAAIALGAFSSMLVRRTSLAVPLSYGLTACYFGLPSLAVVFLEESLGFPWSNSASESFAVLLSPIASGFQFVGDLLGPSWRLVRDPFLSSTTLLVVHGLAVSAFVGLALSFAHRRWLGRQRNT